MEWKDLEPGDVVKFRDKTIQHFHSEYVEWAKFVTNKTFVIKDVKFYDDYISVFLNNYHYSMEIAICYNGTPRFRFSGFFEPILEIVSLKVNE